MQEKSKEAKINQILSAFLVIAYVICMYFFSNLISGIASVPLQLLANIAMYVVFGLLLFYATRVGDGKQVKRFSLSVLLLMVVPGLYIVLAAFAPGLPLHTEITNSSVLSSLGYIMLGYGIPYSFVSGYELAPKEDALEQGDTLPGGEDIHETGVLEEAEDDTANDTDKEETAQDETQAGAGESEEQKDEEKVPADSAK